MQTTPKECDKNFEISGKVEEMRQNSGLAHCMYSNNHWDFCSDYRKIVKYIKKNKSKDEQELLLKMFKLIPNKLVPGRESKEWEDCVMAGQSYAKTWEAFDKAWKAYEKLSEYAEFLKCEKALEDLNKAMKPYKKAHKVYFSKYAEELQTLHDKMFTDCHKETEKLFLVR